MTVMDGGRVMKHQIRRQRQTTDGDHIKPIGDCAAVHCTHWPVVNVLARRRSGAHRPMNYAKCEKVSVSASQRRLILKQQNSSH